MHPNPSITTYQAMKFDSIPSLVKCPSYKKNLAVFWIKILSTDSKKSLPDMNILNIVWNSPNHIPTIPKILWTEISAKTEISTQFDPHTIIEFQIYRLVFILQAILGKNVATPIEINLRPRNISKQQRLHGVTCNLVAHIQVEHLDPTSPAKLALANTVVKQKHENGW